MLVRQMDGVGKEIQKARVIKYSDGNVLTDAKNDGKMERVAE